MIRDDDAPAAPGPAVDAGAGADLAILDLPRSQIARLFAFRHWILTAAREITDTHQIVKGVGEGFVDVGMHLDRLTTAVEVRHATRSAVGRIWEPGVPPREIFFPHGPAGEEAYRASPFGTAHASGEWVRFDPRVADAGLFGVVEELKAAGFTDYICVPVFGAGGMKNGFSFASKAAGGFSEADLAILRFVLPALGGLMELLVIRRILNEVARIYLGEEPARQVLAGDVQRGEVMTMRAVILFADMRRFTETSMRLTTQETADLLNDYYDCVVGPVEERGGQVLKFIADGVLAIFHADEGHEATATGNAVAASRAALDAVAALNDAGTAPAPFEIGIGLHLGEAAYGNVGSGERQDYTVIGRDVNIASRIAGLCGALEQPLILSAECAAHLDAGAVDEAGRFALKGVPGETPVFVPRPATPG